MNKLKDFAAKALLVLFSLTLIFHLLVITGLIPYDIVWAGRLKSNLEMYVFESFSILINLFFLLVIYAKFKAKSYFSPKLISRVLWFMVVIFALNSIGNLYSISDFERYFFTPLTILISLFALILTKKTKNTNSI